MADYTDSGFNTFLTRSIDDAPGNTLDAVAETGLHSRAINYDASQISGALGDTLRLGSILLDGKHGRILVSDGEADRALIGVGTEGDFNFKISTEGHDVLSAADRDLVLNSKYPDVKIFLNETRSYSGQLDTYTNLQSVSVPWVRVPHNLGFIPYGVYYTWSYTNSSVTGRSGWTGPTGPSMILVGSQVGNAFTGSDSSSFSMYVDANAYYYPQRQLINTVDSLGGATNNIDPFKYVIQVILMHIPIDNPPTAAP